MTMQHYMIQAFRFLFVWALNAGTNKKRTVRAPNFRRGGPLFDEDETTYRYRYRIGGSVRIMECCIVLVKQKADAKFSWKHRAQAPVVDVFFLARTMQHYITELADQSTLYISNRTGIWQLWCNIARYGQSAWTVRFLFVRAFSKILYQHSA